ncbi:MAG TPA: flagellar biosynthetic protein FliR, partial [Candidatus Acidoferrum sp.]|nr:flagellar biosynthetic protein FliR [Candidatus Acidoferrum sp.]
MTLDGLVGRWGPTFVMLLARCGGVVVFGPVVGQSAVPPSLRAGLAGGLALLLTPLFQGRGLALPADPVALVAVLTGELAVGAVLGLAVRFTFAGIGM